MQPSRTTIVQADFLLSKQEKAAALLARVAAYDTEAGVYGTAPRGVSGRGGLVLGRGWYLIEFSLHTDAPVVQAAKGGSCVNHGLLRCNRRLARSHSK